MYEYNTTGNYHTHNMELCVCFDTRKQCKVESDHLDL